MRGIILVMANTVTIKPNGPLVVEGNIYLYDNNGKLLAEGNTFFLCRCGASGNKPYCDGNHKNIPFIDDANFTDERAEPIEGDADAPLHITVRDNAMLIAKGPMHIKNRAGTSQTTRNRAALCRCSNSDNKPFCDASHKTC